MVLIEIAMTKLDNSPGKFSDPDKPSEGLHVGQSRLGYFGPSQVERHARRVKLDRV